MEFKLINESKRDKKTIKTSFDWPAFFSVWIFGMPHFLRGQTKLGILIIVVGLTSILIYMPGMSEAEKGFAAISYLVFYIGLSIYLGRNGRKMLTKHLLGSGYSFENEESEIVAHYKQRWGII
jgi:hypothetical protein